MDQELNVIKINLSPETIDESYLTSLGGQIKILLQAMFGGEVPTTSISGSRQSVEAFAKALGNEKRYIGSLSRFGLTDPRTLGNRHKLERAIAGFERATGIKWPFK